ncbi:MAG TPA: SGNH/GDSL hydrolase family protein [Acidimicrobiia bacterium]|nr:SGNH/GDSL hydrolase family protein [Acidimicrobiia bacterium]
MGGWSRRALLIALALSIVLEAGAAVAAAQPTRTGAASTATRYYVSLGDSYAVGYQPGRGITRHGFADQVVSKATRRGYHLQLVNFGCGGATTTSILHAPGCPVGAGAHGGPGYEGVPQAAAAEAFLQAHPGQIALVTVSIGGNDVTACARATDPVACVTQATAEVKANVSQLAAGLRAAAGSTVPIVGTTYPDVILGQWVRSPVSQNLARLSVTAFQALINPALQQSYATAGARFVDVTSATGAYVPLKQTVSRKPYGVIPVAVARACTFSYYCSVGDIHATTLGYGVIADLIVATLPRA